MRFVDIYINKELFRNVDKIFRMSTKIKKQIRKPSKLKKNTKILKIKMPVKHHFFKIMFIHEKQCNHHGLLTCISRLLTLNKSTLSTDVFNINFETKMMSCRHVVDIDIKFCQHVDNVVNNSDLKLDQPMRQNSS